MIPARLSFRYVFTPIPSNSSVFVYMITAQNLIRERVIPVQVHPGHSERDFYSGMYENFFRCHVTEYGCLSPKKITLPVAETSCGNRSLGKFFGSPRCERLHEKGQQISKVSSIDKWTRGFK